MASIALLALLCGMALGVLAWGLVAARVFPGASRSMADPLRQGALMWLSLLGAPLHLRISYRGDLPLDITASARVLLLPVGMVLSLPFMLAGAAAARWLRAANEAENLVLGLLVAPVAAVLAAAATPLLSFSGRTMALRSGEAVVGAWIQPFHAAAAVLTWGLPAAALGALLRYAFWSRKGGGGAWEALRRGSWPVWSGVASSVLLVSVLSIPFCAAAERTVWAWPAFRHAVSIREGELGGRAVRVALATGTTLALGGMPHVAVWNAPVLGQIMLVAPNPAESGGDVVPDSLQIDTTTTLDGASAQSGGLAVRFPRPMRWGLAVPLLGSLLGAWIAAALRGRPATLGFWLGLAALQAVGFTALGFAAADWLTAAVQVPGLLPEPGLQVWAWWHPQAAALLLQAAVLSGLGAAAGIGLGGGWRRAVEEISRPAANVGSGKSEQGERMP